MCANEEKCESTLEEVSAIEVGQDEVIPPDFLELQGRLSAIDQQIRAKRQEMSLEAFVAWLGGVIAKLEKISRADGRKKSRELMGGYIEVYKKYYGGLSECNSRNLEREARIKEYQRSKEAARAELLQYLREYKSTDIQDEEGWADAIIFEMEQNGLPYTAEVLAMVTTVIERESSFQSEPTIPDPMQMFQREKEHITEKYKEWIVAVNLWDNALIPRFEARYLPEVRKLKTEADIEVLIAKIREDEDLQKIREVPAKGEEIYAKIIDELSGLVSTVGSMQVNVRKAMAMARTEGHNYNEAEMRQILYTRDGGLHYGIKMLAEIIKVYADRQEEGMVKLTDGRAAWIISDYNSGIFSSRNAGVQGMLKTLMNSGEQTAIGAMLEAGAQALPDILRSADLQPDGDLLAYQRDGKPKEDPSKTEKVFREFVKKYKVGLSDEEIRRDLLREKRADFIHTALYVALTNEYKRKGPRVIVAVVPNAQADKDWAERKFGSPQGATQYAQRRIPGYIALRRRYGQKIASNEKEQYAPSAEQLALLQ